VKQSLFLFYFFKYVSVDLCPWG